MSNDLVFGQIDFFVKIQKFVYNDVRFKRIFASNELDVLYYW